MAASQRARAAGARRPYTPIQLNDPAADRLQAQLQTYLDELDERVTALLSPAVLVIARDAVVRDEALVDYRGTGGHRIMLPAADSAGRGKGRFVHILNNGSGTVSVAAPGGNRVDELPELELGAGSSLMAAANGDSLWSSLRAGAAPTVSEEWYSPVRSAEFFFAQSAGNVEAQTGNFTVGDKFSSTRELTCTGVRFFWKTPGSDKTVKCRLYASSTSVADINVPVSASGVYEGIFPSPVVMNPYQDYAATIYETTGNFFPRIPADGFAPFGAEPIIGMIPTGPFTIARSFKRNAAGDGVPVNTSSTSFYPVEPIIAPFILE